MTALWLTATLHSKLECYKSVQQKERAEGAEEGGEGAEEGVGGGKEG